MTIYSNQDKLRAIERELNFRRKVYPRWVADKKMSQKFADEQIAIFEDIADDYAKQIAKDRLI